MANFYIKKLKVLGFDGYVWSVDGDRHPQEGRVYRTYQQARRVLMDLRRNAVAQNDMQALLRALEAGNYNIDYNQLRGPHALQVEDITAVMERVRFP
jgi:hypothetical protein